MPVPQHPAHPKQPTRILEQVQRGKTIAAVVNRVPLTAVPERLHPAHKDPFRRRTVGEHASPASTNEHIRRDFPAPPRGRPRAASGRDHAAPRRAPARDRCRAAASPSGSHRRSPGRRRPPVPPANSSTQAARDRDRYSTVLHFNAAASPRRIPVRRSAKMYGYHSG